MSDVLQAATRCGVFVNYRHDDTGWAANLLTDALRRRLGRSSEVFIDNRSNRLFDPDDWVRREILLARQVQSIVVPVLVDRDTVPAAALPDDLAFVAGLQAGSLRQAHPEDLDVLTGRIAKLLPSGCHGTTVSSEKGVAPTRPAVGALLKHILPPAQQWSGNRDRLVDLVLALLSRDDRLVYLVPARFRDRPRGSATMIVTRAT